MKSDAGTRYQYEHELPHRSFLAPVSQLMALFRKAGQKAGPTWSKEAHWEWALEIY